MKSSLKQNLILSLYLALLLLGGITSRTYAADTQPVEKLRVILTLNELQPIQMGMPILLEGNIRDRLGTPIAGKSIVFYMGNEVIGQISSDVNGDFSRTIYKDLDAGSYKITAVSRDTRTLLATASTTTLNVQPAMLFVQTTPAIAGVTFSVGGRKFYSNEEGLARIKIYKVGHYNLQVLTDEYKNPTQRIEFGRWLEEIYVPQRDLYIPHDTFVQVGLNVFHLMGQNFVDLDGFPIDTARISGFTFRSLQGDSFSFQDGTPRWIPASRVARWTSVLSETRIYYSVTGVVINGSNVVNQSQQRFYTSAGGTWDISLILYSLQVNARDGLFGSPVGKSITLEYPDGHKANFPMHANGSVTIHSLARGTYYITVNGVSGMKNRTPVALSKNQIVNSKILTSLDISFAVGVLGLLALGMLFIGRPWLLGPLRRPSKAWIRVKVAAAERISKFESRIHPRGKEINRVDAWLINGRSIQATGLSREGYERLLKYLEGALPPPPKAFKLPLTDQLTMTLKYLKKGTSKDQLARDYEVSRSTVQRTIQRVHAALNSCDEFQTSSRLGTLNSVAANTNARLRFETLGLHSDLEGTFK